MAIKELIGSYIECAKSRPIPLLHFTWQSLMCLFISSAGIPSITNVIKLFVAMSFIGWGVYFFNDLKDLKEDLKNKEHGNPIPANRPLGSGKVSIDTMSKFVTFSVVFGTLVSFTINIQVFLLQLLFLALGIVYSSEPLRLKKRFLGKTLTISAGTIIANVSGALTFGMINLPIIFCIIFNTLLAAFLSPIADIRDLPGDRISGNKTIPILWGPKSTIRLSLAVLASSEIAALIGYSRIGFNIAMPLLSSIIIIMMMYVIYPLLHKWNDPFKLEYITYKKVFPLLMLTQIPIYIGVLNL